MAQSNSGDGGRSKPGRASAAADGGFEMRQRDPEQEPLFPKEELIIPPAIQSWRKSVAILHGLPTKPEYALGLNGLRVFDACIIIAQIDFRQRGKAELERVIKDRLSPIFEFRVGELARLANIPGKNFTRIWDELDALYEASFLWNVIGEDGAVDYEMKSRFLSTLGKGVGGKTGMVRIAFDPAVLQMVLEPTLWATLSFAAMEDKNLRSAPAYLLYQNTWRYVNTHQKVTAAMPTETWIDLIAGKGSRFLTDIDGEMRATGYADFKRRVLLPAMARVNDVRALSYTLELKEFKAGNRVAKLQFSLVPKKQESLGLPLVWADDVLKFLTSCGFTDGEINDLSESHSYEEVIESIARMRASMKRMREAKKKISSLKAYFRGTLANVAAGAREDDPEKIEVEARKQEAEALAEQRKKRSLEEWEQYRARRFNEGFWELPDAQREQLLQEFKDSDDARAATSLLARGVGPGKNAAAMAFIRSWVAKARPDVMDKILFMPEELSHDAWMTWRMANGTDQK